MLVLTLTTHHLNANIGALLGPSIPLSLVLLSTEDLLDNGLAIGLLLVLLALVQDGALLVVRLAPRFRQVCGLVGRGLLLELGYQELWLLNQHLR